MQYALRSAHYLTVHDALKSIRSNCIVEAFVTNQQLFRTNMTCQIPEYKPEAMFSRIVHDLQNKLINCTVLRFKHKVEVTFTDGQLLSCSFGPAGHTVAELNNLASNTERGRIRPAFGADHE